MPPEVLILGALTSPRFYLFSFYMITDPKTSAKGRKEQILWALAVVLIDLWLHTRESLSTLFYALFLVSATRLVWMHARDFLRSGFTHLWTTLSPKFLARVATVTFLGVCGYATYAGVIQPGVASARRYGSTCRDFAANHAVGRTNAPMRPKRNVMTV